MNGEWTDWVESASRPGEMLRAPIGYKGSFVMYADDRGTTVNNWDKDPSPVVAGPFDSLEAAHAAWELISEGGTK